MSVGRRLAMLLSVTLAGSSMLVSGTGLAASPISSPSTIATPTLLPATSSAWGRVPFEAGLRDPFGSSSMVAVTSGPSGIVAVGSAPTGAAAWRSVDGLTWQRALQPPSWDRAGLRDVTATATGYIAVGDVDVTHGGRYRTAGAAWTSEDGLQWRRVAQGLGSAITRVTTSSTGLVAVVKGTKAGEEVIASTNGVDWRTIRPGTGHLDMPALLADGSILMAGGSDFDPQAGWHAAITVSRDEGATWQDAAFAGDPTGSIGDIVPFGGGYVAVGQGG